MGLTNLLRGFVNNRKPSQENKTAKRSAKLPERPIFELTQLEQRVFLSSSFWSTSYNFEGGSPDTTNWSTSTVSTSNSISGWSSTKYLNGPSTLTLTGLPAHAGALVTFNVYALDEWDGGSTPTRFTLTANGVSKVNVSLANDWSVGDDVAHTVSSTSHTQSFPSADGDAYNAARTNAIAVGDMNNDGLAVTGYDSEEVWVPDEGGGCCCGGDCCGCGGDCCGGGGGDPGGHYETQYTAIHGNIDDAVYTFTVPVSDGTSTLALAFGQSGGSNLALGIDNVRVDLATPEPASGNADGNGVDMFTGNLDPIVDGLSSDGFSIPIDSDAAWGNGDAANAVGGVTGNNVVRTDVPMLIQDSGGSLVGQNGTNLEWFDSSGTNAWTDRYAGLDTIAYESTNTQYKVETIDGIEATFYDFSHGTLSGQIKTEKDQDGTQITYSYNGSNQLSTVVRNQTVDTVHTWEQFTYSYSSGQVSNVVLGRKSWDTGQSQSDPGSYTTVRKTIYTYYGVSVTGGNSGDLELAQTEDASNNVLDSEYFRYYISGDADTHGYIGGIKYVLGSDSYTRLAAHLTGGTTPLTASDTDVKPFADYYYQYNSEHQITSVLAQGQGTTTYTYDSSDTSGDGFNVWTSKTSKTDPSGATETDYFNSGGQQMLSVVNDGSNYWGTYTHYDSSGRVDLVAGPSAVTIPNLATIEAYRDLLNGGSYLNDSSGLITTTSYYSSTTATSSPGGVAGYVEDTYIQQGETGTPIHQSHTTYYKFTAGSQTVYPVAVSTVYGDDAGSDARSTTYAYTMYTSTVQTKLETITKPNIGTGQNGPNSADVSSTFYDVDGRPIWTKDADGHVNYTAYNEGTGAVVKTIADVVYASLSGAEQTSFGLTGWSNPSGGLHLVSTYAVDSLGRTTKTTSPNGVVSYTVYNDTGYETRSYSGWQSASGTATSNGSTTTLICTSLTGGTGSYIGQTLVITAGTDSGQQKLVTGWNAGTHTLTVASAFSSATSTSSQFILAGQIAPIQISRQYRAAAGSTYFSYDESLGIAVAPHLTSSGTPDGTETFSTGDITSLSRNFTNDAGQAIYSDQYFDMTGATYSQTVANSSGIPTDFGTAGTNFYRTQTGYDTAGRQNMSISPTSTITRTVYDALGRTASIWVGTTQTHSGSEWTPATNSGNMMKVEDDEYDSGGVGDGNLTKVTQHVDIYSADDHVTAYLYDWRDRRMLEKDGVESSEGSDVNRPIIYTVYDNAGEVTETDTYDGDAVTPSSTSGVPNAPSSSLLRAKSTSSYDDQGRVYEGKIYSIDQSNGTVGNALTTDTFYDHRGETIAVFSPGGQVSKSVYDGAGRVTTQYITDGGAVNNGGAQQIDWTHAGSVSSDVVLTQSENTYDSDGIVIETITRERFHDDSTSSEGALGTKNSGIYARVSYMTSYYDAADRPTDSVNVGTYNGSTYSRPGTVPSVSDTVLVTHTDYDSAGRAYKITDPRNVVTETFFDLLGRTVHLLQGASGSPATGTADTSYTYDGAGHTLTMTALLAHGIPDIVQTTAYIYGVGGSSGTNLFSNDLILKTEYPDPSTGAASSSSANDVSNTYDLQGERLTMTDQNGTVHTYTYDVLGRQTSDAISAASGIDTTVTKHLTSYTALGSIYQATSKNGSNVVVNQVQYGYNGFGQEIIEYQEAAGAVNTGSSVKTQYNYANGSGNSSRLVSMTYPNGRILDYDYSPTQMPVSGITSTTTTATVTTDVAHGLSVSDKVWIQGAGSHYDGWATVASVPSSTTFTYTIASFTGSSSGTDITEAKLSVDEAISRVDGLQDRAGTSAGDVLEGYSYLGLGTIVERTRAENHTKLTYIQQGGDTLYSGDGGDQYTGLDRFGRVIDQFWIDTSGPTTTDRIQYAYDRDGNVLYEKNDVNSAFSELFQANGVDNETAAYDNLNRLTDFQRGTLSSSGNNGSALDQVSSLNSTFSEYQESWALDPVGNWSTLSTDGGGAVSNSFNKRNQQTAQGGNSMSYDDDGNTLVDQNGKNYVWDGWNKLITLKDTNNTTVLLTLGYDAMGRMNGYDNSGGVTPGKLYYDDQGQVIQSYYSNIYTQLVWAPDYVNDMIARDRNTDGTSSGSYGLTSSGLDERLYAQHDVNWDVTTVLDTSASITERFIYSPYGNPHTLHANWTSFTTPTDDWSYKFQGARWESTGTFSFMGARLLDTQTGRWLTADPSGYSDGANLYLFTQDNSVDRLDPTGLVTFSDFRYTSAPIYDSAGLHYKIAWDIDGGEGKYLYQRIDIKITFRVDTEFGTKDVAYYYLTAYDANRLEDNSIKMTDDIDTPCNLNTITTLAGPNWKNKITHVDIQADFDSKVMDHIKVWKDRGAKDGELFASWYNPGPVSKGGEGKGMVAVRNRSVILGNNGFQNVAPVIWPSRASDVPGGPRIPLAPNVWDLSPYGYVYASYHHSDSFAAYRHLGDPWKHGVAQLTWDEPNQGMNQPVQFTE